MFGVSCLSVYVQESGDEDEDEAEQDNKEDDAAELLGRGHRNALLASRTRVCI